MSHPNQLLLHGTLVGRIELVNFEFDPKYPYQYCRLCGELFQSNLDRKVPYGHTPSNSRIAFMAEEKRKHWAVNHATKRHTQHEHEVLRASGLYMTPEAAHRLAPFGVTPITQMITDQDTSMALLEAPRAPSDDATGS